MQRNIIDFKYFILFLAINKDWRFLYFRKKRQFSPGSYSFAGVVVRPEVDSIINFTESLLVA